MSIKNISATTVKLISVTDLRPIDWNSGKRMAITAGECNVCDRCGALHVKVYEVQADEKVYQVGSGCCLRMFGWTPAKEEVLTAEKVAKDRAVQSALMVVAQPIIDQVNAIPVPALKYHSSRWTIAGYDYIFLGQFEGNESKGIRVESGKGTLAPLTLPRLKTGEFFFPPSGLPVHPCEQRVEAKYPEAFYRATSTRSVPVCPTVRDAFCKMLSAAFWSLSITSPQRGQTCVLTLSDFLTRVPQALQSWLVKLGATAITGMSCIPP